MAQTGPYRSSRQVSSQPRLELGLRARVLLQRGSVLAAVLLLLLTSMVAWHVAGWSSLLRPMLGEGPHAKAEAVIESVSLRGAGQMVGFRFITPDGRTIHGVSFGGPLASGIAAGDHQDVEYDPAHPQHARIEGFSEAFYRPWHLFHLGWLLAPALVLLVMGLRAGAAQLHMLAIGRLVPARFVRMDPTRDGEPAWLIYEYTATDGTPRTARAALDWHLPIKGSADHLLLHPADESAACPLGSLPSGLRVVDGRVHGSWPAWLALFAVAALAIQVVGALWGGMPPIAPFF